MDGLGGDMRDVKQRLAAVEIQVGQFASTEASHYASTAVRLDRLKRHAGVLPA